MDITTLFIFTEYLIGLYFLGISIIIHFKKEPTRIETEIDWFSLILSIILLFLALTHQAL